MMPICVPEIWRWDTGTRLQVCRDTRDLVPTMLGHPPDARVLRVAFRHLHVAFFRLRSCAFCAKGGAFPASKLDTLGPRACRHQSLLFRCRVLPLHGDADEPLYSHAERCLCTDIPTSVSMLTSICI